MTRQRPNKSLSAPPSTIAAGPSRSERERARAHRRRYLSGRGVVSLIALASLVVPGIVALIADAMTAF
jgi:hypothetical protein